MITLLPEPFLLYDLTDSSEQTHEQESRIRLSAEPKAALSQRLPAQTAKPPSAAIGEANAGDLASPKQTKHSQDKLLSQIITETEVEAAKKGPEIHVFGSVAVDLSCDYAPLQKDGDLTVGGIFTESPQMQTSNIATIVPSIGGVGHNVALAAHLASGSPSVKLRSFVGDDL